MEHGGVSRNRRAVAAACVGVVVIAAYAVVGAMQILVWNPLAAVPGKSLDQIRNEMAAAGGSLGEPVVGGFVAIGIALALALLAGAALGRVRPGPVIVLGLVLLVLGAPAYWIASFGAGMSIADTFATHGGDHAPWGWMLQWISLGALVGLAVFAVTLGLRRRRPRAA
ncbi:hypothetical protein BIU82_11205 [Arthrobacter sp. SW1]|uniref:hypothetical protein n=1 Tax=Arthrobacter sp. SW1 TaxID=1920889 RepID=UPI000877E47F|nr:hypothetical protein [Arthrobacter sp. SW1]OFI36977.1 hypothetical protein BIU82_11205 [Arthrobacter sp. SW1]